VIACRQNLKTALFKMCALGWLFVTDQRLIVWSAHEFSTAQEAHRDLAELIEGSAPLRRRLKAVHHGAADKSIETTSGQRVVFKARTATGGRGLSGDKIVLDEAFALQPAHIGALFPTLSARPDPQLVYGSSAGQVQSGYLRGIRDRGRAGDDPRLCYLEWCDDLGGECEHPVCDHAVTRPGCRLDDERRWIRANPALGRRISFDFVRAERRAMPPAEFARELLGWWDEATLRTAGCSLPVCGRRVSRIRRRSPGLLRTRLRWPRTVVGRLSRLPAPVRRGCTPRWGITAEVRRGWSTSSPG